MSAPNNPVYPVAHKTRLVPFDDAGIAEAASLIRDGQCVAVPTETVYGLAADATNAAAVALWQALGFAIVGTVPQAFEHPDHGYVGLHVMHRFL